MTNLNRKNECHCPECNTAHCAEIPTCDAGPCGNQHACERCEGSGIWESRDGREWNCDCNDGAIREAA